MTVVQETLVLPGGEPAAYAVITVQLYGPDGAAYAPPDETIVASEKIRANTEGFWTLDLTPNSDIVPSGTVWRRTVTAARSSRRVVADDFFSVPDGGGSYEIQEILDEPPDSLPSSALSAHMAEQGQGSHLPEGGVEGDMPIVGPGGVVAWGTGTAVQPGDLAPVAFSGDYGDLDDKPSLAAAVPTEVQLTTVDQVTTIELLATISRAADVASSDAFLLALITALGDTHTKYLIELGGNFVSRTSDTTFDTVASTASLPANSKWETKLYIPYEAPAADLKMQFTGPAGFDMTWGGQTAGSGLAAAGTAGTINVRARTAAQTEILGGAGVGSTRLLAVIQGIIRIGANAGAVNFQAGQQASDPAASTIYAGTAGFAWLLRKVAP